MTKKIKKDELYYDNREYDSQYKDLMIDLIHKSLEDGKYYDNPNYNKHFENVFGGLEDEYSFDEEQRFYEDPDMNINFINMFIKKSIKKVSDATEFKNAFNNTDVNFILLDSNITVSENLKIENGRELAIDLNNKKLTYSGSNNLTVGGDNNSSLGTGGTLVISNGTLDLGSKALRVYANNDKTDRDTVVNSKLVLGKDCNVKTLASSVIGVMGKGAELYVDKECGTIETTGTNSGVIMGNGNSWCAGTKIVIDGGTFKVGSDTGSIVIYHPQSGELIINGGTFEGADGIQLKAGVASIASISGATIKATGAKVEATIPENDGSVFTGSALSLIGNTGYTGSMSVTIDGNVKLESLHNPALVQTITVSPEGAKIEKLEIKNGEFIGSSDSSAILINNYSSIQDKVFVEGGLYSSSNVSDYLKDGYVCVAEGTKYRVKKG